MNRTIAAISVALILFGCAGSGVMSAPNASPVSLAPVCPAVKNYTLQEQQALAKAVAALAADNPIIGAMGDYGRMRAASRACIKK